MRKRERENPCDVCGHYHKYEEGEVCGICGHRMPVAVEHKTSLQLGAFPSEILPEFLYLGSYDNASRSELLKTRGISRVLNTVPACQNLDMNCFTYHFLKYEQKLPFEEAAEFLEQCEKDKARVLVHCMTGRNRSPAVVMAYLMRSKGWRLDQSYQWVKDRRPSVELNQALNEQLIEYEKEIFDSIENSNFPLPTFSSSVVPSFSFGFPNPNNDPVVPVPAFNMTDTASIFARLALEMRPQEFTFGASPTHNDATDKLLVLNPPDAYGNDVAMEGS